MSSTLTEPSTSDDPPSSARRSPRARGLAIRVLADSDGNVTLRISGKLDIYTAAQLRTRMDRHDPAVESISVDISEVWHIDSTGLGTLMSFANRARRSGRRLGLVCGPEFLELLEFTRMTDAFDLMPTDALA